GDEPLEKGSKGAATSGTAGGGTVGGVALDSAPGAAPSLGVTTETVPDPPPVGIGSAGTVPALASVAVGTGDALFGLAPAAGSGKILEKPAPAAGVAGPCPVSGAAAGAACPLSLGPFATRDHARRSSSCRRSPRARASASRTGQRSQ